MKLPNMKQVVLSFLPQIALVSLIGARKSKQKIGQSTTSLLNYEYGGSLVSQGTVVICKGWGIHFFFFFTRLQPFSLQFTIIFTEVIPSLFNFTCITHFCAFPNSIYAFFFFYDNLLPQLTFNSTI